ncbi:uncharacterized protein LOC115447887 [Manduca sexta]|uniref:Uncharacterized protein n=1 Tax=Manduca sexta TaxID=7130 RepID=A0A922CSP8_MANSE|nr:uncharacterized protein LOC115447887 [Manduca sexta]XP_030031034.1 uncharacterized protein LOC115447887 [Manduca sexta]XP_030031035.1 uncharacterized protein LOC115447887 [Manduca sexta]KAG6456949.1 hypothetical protein O3G_MSEX010051 [Manduca sexta]KAG6456950.1 hypothetical protein O3G_MSEX010051 [Manduca sexta]KAG6456951.1 hypothetical protein O3G_MSEX010051 [Manduca sexta]
MADNILSQMAMFDFSAPIQTVTIFDDDSDEEKCCSSSKKQRIDKSLIAESFHHEIDIINSSDEEVYIKEDIDIENDCVIKNKEKDDSVTSKNVEETSKNTQKPIDAKKSQPNEQDVLPKNKVQNKESVNLNNVENFHIDSQSTHDINAIPDVQYERISQKSIPEQVNTVTSLNNFDPTNDNEIMSAYLKKLINKVSDHLLVILGAYRHYVNAHTTGNAMLIEKRRKHYIQIKHHFFNLSSLVVETLFVPQVHTQSNFTFARNFIECTMRIAKAKSIECSFEHIEPLYFEMLEWTKEKSKYYNNISLFYLTSKLHSTVQSINKNFEITKQNAQHLNTQNVIASKNKCLNFTTGPPRVGGVYTQICPHYPTVRPNLDCNTNNIRYNHEITNHPNFFGGNVCNNNLSNPAVRGTCLQNGQRAFQICVYCQQMQGNMMQHAASTTGGSHTTSMDPINYNAG